MKYAAVVFDLFGTLIDNLSLKEHRTVLKNMASVLSAPSDGFVRLWFDTFNERSTGIFRTTEANIEHICHQLGVHPENTRTKSAARIRFDYVVQSMIPRPDAIETLSHLKSGGCKTGLISDCSAEVPAIWQDTPFVELIDVAIFSCSVGVKKPDPRIYHLAVKQLKVRPEDCLYVGDGSSQELTGAVQVGMHPFLLRDPHGSSVGAHYIDREEWDGPAISSLKDILTSVSGNGQLGQP